MINRWRYASGVQRCRVCARAAWQSHTVSCELAYARRTARVVYGVSRTPRPVPLTVREPLCVLPAMAIEAEPGGIVRRLARHLTIVR